MRKPGSAYQKNNQALSLVNGEIVALPCDRVVCVVKRLSAYLSCVSCLGRSSGNTTNDARVKNIEFSSKRGDGDYRVGLGLDCVIPSIHV